MRQAALGKCQVVVIFEQGLKGRRVIGVATGSGPSVGAPDQDVVGDGVAAQERSPDRGIVPRSVSFSSSSKSLIENISG